MRQLLSIEELSRADIERLQAGGEQRAAAMDADESDVVCGVVLHDLVRDAHERAAHVVAVEDDLRLHRRDPSWPRRTGLKEPPRGA